MVSIRRVDPDTLRPMRLVRDVYIAGPLWEWPPGSVPDVLHERRVRFGIPDERIDPDDIPEEDSTL